MAKKDVTLKVEPAPFETAQIVRGVVERFTVAPTAPPAEPAMPRKVPRHTVSTGAPAADPEPQQPAQE